MPAAAAHEDAGGATGFAPLQQAAGGRRGMRSPHGAHHLLPQEVFNASLAISNYTLLRCIKMYGPRNVSIYSVLHWHASAL